MDYRIHYTGHPFVDVGVATLVAHANVQHPEELEAHHLEAFEAYAKPIYLKRMLLGYISYVVFPNLVNAGLIGEKNWEKFAEKRQDIVHGLFSLWKWDGKTPYPAPNEVPCQAGETCVFCGQEGVVKMSQRLVPMVGGEDSINFFPEGTPKMALCRACTIALLAMPFGTLNSDGKCFIVHSHHTATLQQLVKLYLGYNIRDFALPNLAKRPNHKYPKTQLIENLIQAGLHTSKAASITAYLFVASSQNADIQIFHLPSSIIDFVRSASRADEKAWQQIVNRAWELEKVSKSKESKDQEEDNNTIVYGKRNFFYEALFDLPQNAVSFLRTYLLRNKTKGKTKTDPSYTYSFIKEREAISWTLISLFMEKVMNMERKRIEAIRNLGERLASYIQEVDSRFYRTIYLARGESNIRSALIKAANVARTSGTLNEPLLPFDEFIDVFFYTDDANNLLPDWYLAKDLLLVRIMECLNPQWIRANQDELEALASDSVAEQAS